jgi:serine/threonine protein kinase
MTAKPSPAPPTQIDKYTVVRQLGAGAMGCVYEAKHKGTSRRVAVKLISEEAVQGPGVVERFQREARAAGVIESEHITQVLDSGTDPTTGAPYLVMELLAGEDLSSLARRLKPMRPDLALRIVAQALRGLESAHAANVIHRDIKPPNMFLARKENGEYVVKLCDFGIAKVEADALASSQNHALTHTSALLGSPGYMSPEQVKGAKGLDRRTDLWSMGVVLYELLVGEPPYPDADTLGLILLAICSDPPALVQENAPWVSAEAAAVVKKAMQTDRAKRFQTAREMLDAILALLPNGTSLNESMFTAITEEECLFQAPRPSVVITVGDVRTSSASRTIAADSSGRTATLVVDVDADAEAKPVESPSAVARTGDDAPPPRPVPRRWTIGAGAAGLALVVGGVMTLNKAPAKPELPPVVVSAAPPAASSAPPVPSVSAAAPSAAASVPLVPVPSALPKKTTHAAPRTSRPASSVKPAAVPPTPSAASSISREFN